MPGSAAAILRGAIFEWYVRNLLFACGFRQVTPDDAIIYRGGPGLMVHGLGQPHNADVLMDPPFQIPFYFRSRLLVECKWYSDPLGISFVRNALGLREDLNGFDVVTDEVLLARRNYRRRAPVLSPFDRVLYQVAVASVSGFKVTGLEFAEVHRIPLISMAKGPVFHGLRSLLLNSENIRRQINQESLPDLLEFLRGGLPGNGLFPPDGLPNELRDFLEGSQHAFPRVLVGVLDSGNIVFLTSAGRGFNWDGPMKRSAEIYYEGGDSNWHVVLPQTRERLDFELPEGMYEAWAETDFDRSFALNQKETHFRRIHVFGIDHGMSRMCIFEISDEFFRRWRRRDRNPD